MNLLQPQERRSRAPGDPETAVLARRRLFDRGILEPIYARLRKLLAHEQSIVDVGCGEGHLAGPSSTSAMVVGIDLSSKAIELAARRWPSACWVVANADRQIPVIDGSTDVVVSVAARRNPAEFARVLKPGGRALVAVPAADDLIELRERIGGEAMLDSRVDVVRAEFRDGWEVRSTARVADRVECDHDAVVDVLASSYRGQRRSAAPVLQEMERMSVTIAFDVLEIAPVSGAGLQGG